MSRTSPTPPPQDQKKDPIITLYRLESFNLVTRLGLAGFLLFPQLTGAIQNSQFDAAASFGAPALFLLTSIPEFITSGQNFVSRDEHKIATTSMQLKQLVDVSIFCCAVILFAVANSSAGENSIFNTTEHGAQMVYKWLLFTTGALSTLGCALRQSVIHSVDNTHSRLPFDTLFDLIANGMSLGNILLNFTPTGNLTKNIPAENVAILGIFYGAATIAQAGRILINRPKQEADDTAERGGYQQIYS